MVINLNNHPQYLLLGNNITHPWHLPTIEIGTEVTKGDKLWRVASRIRMDNRYEYTLQPIVKWEVS